MKIYLKKKSITRLTAFFLSAVLIVSVFPLVIYGDVYETYDLPWVWPVPGSYKINSLDYYYDGGMHSNGACIDISPNGYTGANRLDVVSATNGYILAICNKYDEKTNKGSGWGNYVIVQSGDINIVYAHLQTVNCGYGEISVGDVIGKMGTTGNSTGVHLHIQAYPVGKQSTDNSIRVFDRYIKNPLYYEKFEFMKGLQNTSVVYGEHISSCYKTLSGSYYRYSGGINDPFDTVPVCASVTVIKTDGAPVRTLPVADNSYITDTLEFLQNADITGYYTDAYGVMWLELAEDIGGGKWICFDDVGFHDYGFSVNTENETVPSGQYGAYCDIYFGGTVTSENLIDSYYAEIKRNGIVVASYEKQVNASAASLADITDGFGIDMLDDGDYVFTLTVRESAEFPGVDAAKKETTVLTSEFSVNHKLSDTIYPVIENVSVGSVTSYGFTVKIVATDNIAVTYVRYELLDSQGSSIGKFDAEADTEDTDCYRYVFGTGDLPPEIRSFSIKIAVSDGYGNTVTSDAAVNLVPLSEGELWKAGRTLKVRSGPGTSYTHINSVSSSSTFRIYEAVIGEGYLWGRHSLGYSPLGDDMGDMYCTYSDGSLYTLVFNLNGGQGTPPAMINKRLNVDVTLPKTVPVRKGFTFLGWTTFSGSHEAEYKPSAVYSANSDAVLYAVWGDSDAPVISEIVSDTSEWTGGNVTLKVIASDNDDNLFYSANGGRTWQQSNEFVIEDNTVIPPDSFAVRDTSGNITLYQKEITVSNIDKESPDLENAKITVTQNSGRTSFAASGINDDLSGLSRIELIYSRYSDFSAESTLDITNGGSAILQSGVYYRKVKAYDKAGNFSEKELTRFRVGDSVKLDTPENERVVSTGSGSAELAWDEVTNADKYQVSISKSGLFDDETAAYVYSCTYSANGLEAGVIYYFKVCAICDDGIYETSDNTDSHSFLTKSDDSSVHSLLYMTDAEILTDSIKYTVPFSSQTVNITAETESHASVEYFSDSDLLSPISDPARLPFTGLTKNVYIKVTAENNTVTVYRLDLKRAAESAETPNCIFNADDEEIYVTDTPTELTVIAESIDGGDISVSWYISYNGSKYSLASEEASYTPQCDAAGEYKIFAVITNTNEKCLNKTAEKITGTVTVTVNKKKTEIGVFCPDKVYDGETPAPSAIGCQSDGLVLFYYYSDEECQTLIDAPTDAGSYYVKAYAIETGVYLSAMSLPSSFKISKADNTSTLEYKSSPATLRSTDAKIEVFSDGVEYKKSGESEWTKVTDKTLVFEGGTVVLFRYAEQKNYNAGKTVTVTAEKYEGPTDIILNNDSAYFLEDGKIYIEGSGNTVENVLSQVKKHEWMTLYSRDGVKVTDKNAVIGTGASVAIEDEEGIYMSVDIIILSDLDGDGYVTYNDALQVMYLANGMALTDDELEFSAADLNNDGVITTADAYLAYLRT